MQGQSLQELRDGLVLTMPERMVGLLGIAAMLGIAWLISKERSRISWRLVGIGLALQATFGVLVLKTGLGRAVFDATNRVVTRLLSFQEEGARFVFGNLVQNQIDLEGGAQGFVTTGAYFAFYVLPTIIFFSALMSVLYYLGIMQRVVKGIAWVMQRTLRTSGAETLSAAGNIFVGQTEAPLLIRPFVGKMTDSELNTVMVGGFATVAGGVLAAYVGMLSGMFPDIAGHLLTASVMNAPAAIVISKMLLPELGEPVTRGSLRFDTARPGANVIDAAASGAATGVQLAINVAAMLMAFIALIAMVNFGIGWVGGLVGQEGWSLQALLGVALRPLAWLMGTPWQDADTIGSLIGVKIVLNEFVAYTLLGTELTGGTALSPRAVVIATYALLGFANFSSIAIQLGGIGGLAPERRADLSRLGLRAMVGGNLAAFTSASIAGMLA
jgi:CNT family concentrative nucleoside transporter